jgi:hypothetical protein
VRAAGHGELAVAKGSRHAAQTVNGLKSAPEVCWKLMGSVPGLQWTDAGNEMQPVLLALSSAAVAPTPRGFEPVTFGSVGTRYVGVVDLV